MNSEKNKSRNKTNESSGKTRVAKYKPTRPERTNQNVKTSTTNAISWYSRFPQFTRDAGNLAFGIPLGQPINLGNGDDVVLPGVMKLEFMPGVGYSDRLQSPINRSSIRFYTYLRSIQKAAAKYDSADVMMYFMALDSCYMFHALMRRAYGVANLFTPINKYYPRTLLQTMGFDPSIANNLADFRAYINRFALSLGSYCLPKQFDITNRHMWMCEGLYTDSDTSRAQTYVFVPKGFWVFNNTVETGSELDWKAWMPDDNSATKLHTLAEVQEFGDALINAILNDQDTGDISGDLYAAYKPEGLIRLTETPDMYAILPTFDKIVLSQIENANILGEFPPDDIPKITQDPSVNGGAILFQPTFRSGMKYGAIYHAPAFERSERVINMHVDFPSPEEVIEATRLTVTARTPFEANETTGVYKPTSFGSDIVMRIVIHVANGVTGATSSIVSRTNSITEEGAGTPILQFLALLGNFDYHPIYYGWTGATSGVTNITDIIANVDNVTTVDFNKLDMMHEASMLSLFDVPQMGM